MVPERINDRSLHGCQRAGGNSLNKDSTPSPAVPEHHRHDQQHSLGNEVQREFSTARQSGNLS
jgi:hypothetical protein